jgi:3-hydroxyacyl-[acyl-carrier-protein] dehydratase
MPASQPFIDPRDHPLDRVQIPMETVRRFNPQRAEFEQLTSILHYDKEANLMVGHRRVTPDEFWVPGHLPGRPLVPGALMVEAMAQVASYHSHLHLDLGEEVFIGFGGLDEFRFRGAVEPPADLWIAGTVVRGSRTRVMMKWHGQMLRADGAVVCEGVVIGVGF